MISVNMVDANVYEVIVDGEVRTVHRVAMSQAYYRELCGATVTHEFVVLESFKFLLEREPNTSILREFELPDIGRYFADFESELKSRLNR